MRRPAPSSTPPSLPASTTQFARVATPRRVVAAAFVSGVFGAVAIYARDPETASFLPCAWFEITGTHCPGCGITRALHDLLHGRVVAAFGHNAVGLLVLLVAAGWLAWPAWIALRDDRWEAPRYPRHAARWLIVVGVAWAVLRNLPWAPFTLLAP